MVQIKTRRKQQRKKVNKKKKGNVCIYNLLQLRFLCAFFFLAEKFEQVSQRFPQTVFRENCIVRVASTSGRINNHNTRFWPWAW